MNGMTINGKHTFRDLGLKLKSYKISPAKAIEKKIKVPGMDGALDVSEYTGEVLFEERSFEAKFDFASKDAIKKEKKLSDIQNELNGVKAKIYLDTDPSSYYEGRLAVEYDPKNIVYTELTIKSKFYPYKLKKDITKVTKTIKQQGTVNCRNLRKTVIPKITCNANMNLTFGNITASLRSGTSIVPEVRFKQGDNVVECKGNGTITFEYQEGGF